MPASVKMMSGFLMDQLIQHPDESPESFLIRTEDTPENREGADRANRQEQQNLRIAASLEHEYNTLKARDRALLVAYWRDCCKYPRDFVINKLRLKNNDRLRADKWRALNSHPCGGRRGVCDHVSGCAHSRGEILSNEIVKRVANKLRGEHV